MTETYRAGEPILKLSHPDQYSRWRVRMRNLLERRELWEYVATDDENGKIELKLSPNALPPDADAETWSKLREQHIEWRPKNAKAMLLIIDRVTDNLLDSLGGITGLTARDIWERLEKQYNWPSSKLWETALQHLFSLNLDKCGGEPEKYIQKFQLAMKEIEVHSIDAYNAQRDKEDLRVDDFLIPKKILAARFVHGTLNYPSLQSWRDEVVRDGSYDDVLTMMHKLRETRLPARLQRSTTTQAHVAAATESKDKRKRKCKHCKKFGHVIDDCWTKYPEKRKEY